MIEYSNTLGGGGSSTATLPDQISNLACTGGTDGSHGTIDVSFNEVPSTSFDLLKYYIFIYKADGIPQTPFDGTRITLPKGTAEAKLEHQITGLTYDQLYGVRIYPVSTKNQYQTLSEGATATATPVAGIDIVEFDVGVDVNVPFADGTTNKMKIVGKNHEGYPSNSITLWNDKIFGNARVEPYNEYDPILNVLTRFFNSLHETIKKAVKNTGLKWNPNSTLITFQAFILSGDELYVTRNDTNGTLINYFYYYTDRRIKNDTYFRRDLNSRWVNWVRTNGDPGNIGGNYGSETHGVVPTINIDNTLKLSPIPKADGSYDFLI